MPEPADPPALPGDSSTVTRVVAVGASAGGLKALVEFFQALDVEAGRSADTCYVVIQHLSPDFDSHMVELLARETRLHVQQVTSGIEIAPKALFVIPPGKLMRLEDRRLTLQDREPSPEVPHPIDVFYRSLARAFGPMSVGVILSGTGSDGSKGAVAIAEAGGMVLAQSSESAAFDGMPESAMATGVVAHAETPAELARIVGEWQAGETPTATFHPAGEDSRETALESLFEALKERHGVDFSTYKRATIERRVARRVLELGTQSVEKYAEAALNQPREIDRLQYELLIGVTEFKRDPSAFARLEGLVIPTLLADGEANDPIRVWVPGCATGEEAYSIAIAFMEALRKRGSQRTLRIFATDVHEGAIAVASSGIYPSSAIEPFERSVRERYFSAVDGGFQVRQELRDQLVFARHDLLSQPPFTQLHLVSCRNLLIYFQPEAQAKALGLFHFALRRRGFLFLGPSESLGSLDTDFEAIDPKWRIWRKERETEGWLQKSKQTPMRIFSRNEGRGGPQSPAQDSLSGLYEDILQEALPPSILLDAQFNVIRIFGGAEKYLRMQAGAVSTNVLDLVDPGLRTTLATTIRQAQSTGKTARLVQRADSESEALLTVCVSLFRRHSEAGPTALLIRLLESNQAHSPETDGTSRSDANLTSLRSAEDSATQERQIRYLEEDLTRTRESLQSTVEELETSNEELQATNEELVASNEELQSTNEELQSVNEELFTVNDEREKKIEQIAREKADMDNLLAGTEVGVVFLDLELRLRRFTPQAGAILGLAEHDIGRSINTFSRPLLVDDLTSRVQSVLDTRSPHEERLPDIAGSAYLLRILPYFRSGKVQGTVLTVIDITGLWEAEREVERLKLVVDQSEDMQAIFDRSGRSVYANRAALAGHDTSEDGEGSIRFSDCYYGWTDDRYAELFATAQSQGPQLVESRVQRDDSAEDIDVELRITPAEFGGEALIHVNARDISERKRANAHRELLHKVTAAASEDSTNEELLRRATGLARTTLKAREVSLVRCDSDSDPDCEPALTHWDRTPFGDDLAPMAVRALRESCSGEVAVWKDHPSEEGDGSVGAFCAVKVSEYGGALALLLFTFELAEPRIQEERMAAIRAMAETLRFHLIRRRAERDLRLRNRAMAASTNGIVIADANDPDLELIYVNEGFERMTGYSSEEVIGRNCRFLQGPQTANSDRARMREAIAEGRELQTTILNYRKNGETFWNEVQLTPIRDEGGVLTHFVAVQHDITERIETQRDLVEARQRATSANRAKSRFLANMSHEIRSPMTAILGFADALARRTTDPESLENLGTIQRNADYLLQLIGDILDISRIEANKLEIQLSGVDLPQALADVRDLMGHRAAQKQLEFEVSVDGQLPERTLTDSTRLRQILVNLLANAVKFTSRGRVEMTLRFDLETDKTKGIFYADIADTGIGIEGEALETIFQPFARPHDHADSLSAEFEGSGLGLAIVKRLVSGLRGKISVKSRVGEGSVFSVQLPMRVEEGAGFVSALPSPSAAPTPEPFEEDLLAGFKVLVADDRADVAKVVRFYLEDAGARVETVENGALAVDAALNAESPFDVVILDMQMPVLDGYGAARELRQRGYSGPIIALTAGALKENEGRCLEAGCSSFLTKPAEEADLIRLVRSEATSEPTSEPTRESGQ